MRNRPPDVAFIVYGGAKPAGSKTQGVSKSGRRYIRDSSGKSGERWRALVTDKAGQVMGDRPPFAGPVALRLRFYRSRPKTHYRTNGELTKSAARRPIVAPDALKLARAVEDGMKGILYRDDAQIVWGLNEKHYGEPVRCEVELWDLS